MWGVPQFLFSLRLFSSATQAVASYDYVIIGGGTAGLTIATRLSENPDTSILVLEAGNDHSNDTNVLSPGLYTTMYGNPEYDWNYKTVPQIYANDQEVAHPRGKQLGGSSAINFLFWTHASQQDINNWGQLGNANWSWEVLEPYFTKSENFLAPSYHVEEDLETEYIVPSIHGTSGPINNTFPDIYGPLDEAWPRTYEMLGFAPKIDPRDGLALGGYTNLINMDLKGRTRSYAATGYYLPASKRQNLKGLTRALAEKILIEKGHSVRATGVQYSIGNSTEIVHAKKEVILSAGSIGSPQILELSGIGNPSLLKTHGIDVLVANENVGENLQDHIYVPVAYKVIPGVTTLDNFTDPDYFNAAYEQYITNATGPLATTGASSGLLSCPQIGCGDLIPPAFSNISSSLAAQYSILNKYFQTEAVTQELTVTGGMSPQYVNDTTKLFTTSLTGNFFTLLGVLEHPYSRGAVHIQSSDPTVYPEIDPKYLSNPFDLEVLSRIALHLQKVARTPPLSDLLKGNGTIYQPGYYELDSNNVGEWIKQNLQSEYHPAGTCAMMPKEKGGVVDERFRVYGVDGLRVVDASVFPLMPRANLQTLVYAIAERAANFMKEDDNCL
ncbi:alcohol oxidase [Mollisia scopiformis]|uniref:Alcohol oxidase n=1 Tax=Mollisia scopiformis TaxID=149040 RepID=A0A132BAR1_MOLSC|nr:alcohol oxidase [Mollisia scopiformis]KUJ09476.1 alcohol oxidase [Mollisia scopiformis]